eukprot:gene7735-biopygen13615
MARAWRGLYAICFGLGGAGRGACMACDPRPGQSRVGQGRAGQGKSTGLAALHRVIHRGHRRCDRHRPDRPDQDPRHERAHRGDLGDTGVSGFFLSLARRKVCTIKHEGTLFRFGQLTAQEWSNW